jgi:hypothetical protein
MSEFRDAIRYHRHYHHQRANSVPPESIRRCDQEVCQDAVCAALGHPEALALAEAANKIPVPELSDPAYAAWRFVGRYKATEPGRQDVAVYFMRMLGGEFWRIEHEDAEDEVDLVTRNLAVADELARRLARGQIWGCSRLDRRVAT